MQQFVYTWALYTLRIAKDNYLNGWRSHRHSEYYFSRNPDSVYMIQTSANIFQNTFCKNKKMTILFSSFTWDLLRYLENDYSNSNWAEQYEKNVTRVLQALQINERRIVLDVPWSWTKKTQKIMKDNFLKARLHRAA